MRTVGMRSAGRLGSALLLVVMAIAACELALQAAARYSPFLRYQLSSPLIRNLVPDATLGFRMSPYTPGHDRHGYRNDAPSGQRDIVALGDSMTYGLGAFADGAWPQQVARLTGTRVYNAGVGGYGPCEYLLLVQEMFGLKPTHVLVGVYVGNDIGNAYASVYLQRRCAGLATSDSELRRELAAADRRSALTDLAAEFGDVAPERPAGPGALDGLAVYGLLRSLAYAVATRNQLPNREGRADSFEAAARLPLRVAMASPEAFRTVFRDPRLDLLAVNLDDPRMAEGLRLTVLALERLQDLAAARGAETTVVLIPSKPFVLAPLIEAQEADFRNQFEALIHWESEVTARLVAALDRSGIRVVETAGSLRNAVIDGLMPFHASDDSHPNAQGYGVVAQTVARALSK